MSRENRAGTPCALTTAMPLLTSCRPLRLLPLLWVLTACETGKEVASVQSASAVRHLDGTVDVAVVLGCETVWGMGRGGGSCDADHSDVCVRADWYDAAAPNQPLFQARACAYVEDVLRTVVHVSPPAAIPASPAMTIRTQTEPDLDSRDSAPEPVDIASP